MFGRDERQTAYSYAAPAIQEHVPAGRYLPVHGAAKTTPRYTGTRVSTLARRALRTARSRNAFTSSTPMAKHGKRCIRWSRSPTAA